MVHYPDPFVAIMVLYQGLMCSIGTSMGAVTDSLGNYKIDNIPVGKYVLRADYMGYQPDETEIYISVLQENNVGSEDFSSSFAAKLGLEDDEPTDQIKRKLSYWD